MIRLFLYLIAGCTVADACSQIHTATGIVRDAETRLPIPYVVVSVVPGDSVTQTDMEGRFRLTFPVTDSLQRLHFQAVGYMATQISASSSEYDLTLTPALMLMNSVEIISYSAPMIMERHNSATRMACITSPQKTRRAHTESYSRINENGFQLTRDQSVTTFSVDVDRASYSNIRRFISKGDTPPADAVRIEEMLNYFPYDLPEPDNGHPIAVFTESGECPWNEQHRLMRVALQAKHADVTDTPKGNYVFLIDVSGSMADDNKLPLVVSSMRYLLRQMRPSDRVAIVTYAGQSIVELPSTLVEKKELIEAALDRLESGGSTAGQSGIQLAYEQAQTHFIEGGNNRVILCTDGDFNVGISSPGELERFIEEKRNSGITLTCLGFGMGNFKDDRLETLADKGNGNYAYIDGMLEAQKVLGEEFYGTMYTVAKDVKVQLEFNPVNVQAYRLIGYENRMLNEEDFRNDAVDAGDIGAGYSVTALFEYIPAGITSASLPNVREKKYTRETIADNAPEIATVAVRYNLPEAKKSVEFEQIIPSAPSKMSDDFRFACAVAMFGMYLRESEHLKDVKTGEIISQAESGLSFDPGGYRSEFIRLVKSLE